ncbi:MAG: hypothetical protein R3E39_05010 [Anaerolineae bacterium]
MQFFSQRKGLKPIKSLIQTDNMDAELRNGLWNALYLYYFEATKVARFFDHNQFDRNLGVLAKRLWHYYFKIPADEMLELGEWVFDYLKRYFFSAKYGEVYDFIEAVILYFPDEEHTSEFIKYCNEVLDRERSGYRLVGGQFIDIILDEEIESIEVAIKRSPNPVQQHLKQAIEHYGDRKNPDFRNSIGESMKAVEAICQQITQNPKATLGDALNNIERNKTVELHPALKASLSKLYGYTSDAGIRHAMSDEPNVSGEDARFMLISCSAFINYLTEKAQKAGLKL